MGYWCPSMTALLYVAAILAAFAIAFTAWGMFAVIDMFRINKKDDYE